MELGAGSEIQRVTTPKLFTLRSELRAPGSELPAFSSLRFRRADTEVCPYNSLLRGPGSELLAPCSLHLFRAPSSVLHARLGCWLLALVEPVCKCSCARLSR